MKWENKGHEYDNIYGYIKKKKKLYLFGAGRDGKAVYDIMTNWLSEEFQILGFVDNNKTKQGKTYCGLPVLSYEEIKINMPNLAVIISIVGAKALHDIKEQLKSLGLHENEEFFHYSEFLSVYFAYAKNKLFIHNVSFLPSTVCNLRCECCLNFTPYMKNFEVRDWRQLIADIDIFFQVVDYVELFHVSGGEPLLYPKIAPLLRYIYDNYHTKIHSLETVTNGTILPSKEFIQVFHDYPITITVDDYREALPDRRERFDEVIHVLESAGGAGQLHIQHYDNWIDLAPFETDHSTWNNEQLIRHFDACHALMQEFRDGRLYICNYDAYASVAGIISELPETDSFSFRTYDKSQLKTLMEFRLGYSTRGYAELCKHCAGLFEINPNKVPPAKQIEDRI